MAELKVLKIADIQEAGFSLRDAQTKEPKFLEMVESIKAHGVYEPILVRKFKNPVTGIEGYQLVNGCQRLAASKLAGRTEIPCNIEEMDSKTMMIAQITTNSARVETKAGQYATLIKNLMTLPELQGVSLDYMAGLLHMSKEQLARLMALNKLSDSIKSMVDDGNLTFANAVALSTLPPDAQVEMLDEARKATNEDFKMACAEKKNAIVAEKRGDGTHVPTYIHKAKFRNYSDLEAELTSGTEAGKLLKDVKDVKEAFKLGIQFAVTSTPADITAGKDSWEAKKAADKAAAAAKKAERTAAAAAAAAAEATTAIVTGTNVKPEAAAKK